MGVEFRFARADDVAAVAALVERAYRGPESAKGWASEADILTGPRSSVAEIAELIARADSRFVMAEDADGLAACALIQDHGEGRAYFGMFAVAPDRQIGGIGKTVMAEAERAVAALWRARSLSLTVISIRDTLIAWYERRGYALTGETEPFPFHEHSGALRRDFHLVVMAKALG